MNNRKILSFEDRLKLRRQEVRAKAGDAMTSAKVSMPPIPERLVLSFEQASWLEPCPICKQHPRPMKVQGGYIKRKCRCQCEADELVTRWNVYAQVLDNQRGYNESKISVDRCYTWLGEDYSEFGLEKWTFDNYQTRLLGKAGKVLDAANEASRQFAKVQSQLFAQNPTGNLIIHGSYGLGKTHLACAILNYQRALGHPGLFTTGANLFNALLATKMEDVAGKQAIVARMFSASLLVIDDPDHASATEFRLNTYKEIFNKRSNRDLSTIITTNLAFGPNDDASRLSEVIGGAAADRLNKGLKLIGLRGEKSYRKHQISE